MRRRDGKKPEAFVRARTAELADQDLRASHTALLELVDQLRAESAKEADWEWIEAIAIGLFDDDGGDDLAEDAAFGDDPEKQAATITTAILAGLALTHADHSEYRPEWSIKVRRSGGSPG